MIEPALTVVLGAILGWVMLVGARPGVRHHLEDEVLSAMAARHLLYFTAEDHYLYRSRARRARARGEVLRRRPRRRRRSASTCAAARARCSPWSPTSPARTSTRSRCRCCAAATARRSCSGASRSATATRASPPRSRSARSHGPQRRNERLLLASFTNTQQFTPWLDALEEAGARLAGVYSVPLLAPALAARLGARGARALVVTANRAGLRQCFVEDGKLRFARLERTVDMVPQALAAFVRSETLRLAQYLTTLRALPRDGAPLQVLVVAPRGRARGVRAGAGVGRARRLPDRSTAPRRCARGQAAPGAARAPAPRRSTCTSPRASRRASSSRAAAIAGATSSGSCSARWSPPARSASPPARCTPARAGSRPMTCAQPRRGAERARRAAPPSATQRITATFPVTADHDREPARRRCSSSAASPSAAPRPSPRSSHVSRCSSSFRRWRSTRVNWRVGRPASRARSRSAAAAQRKPERAGRRRRCSSRSPAASTRRSATTTAASPRRCSASPTRSRASGYAARAHAAAVRRHLRRHADRRHRRPRDSGEAPRFTIAAGAAAAMNFTREELQQARAAGCSPRSSLLAAGGGLIWTRATQSRAKAPARSSRRRRPSAGRTPSAWRASPRRSAK